MKEMWKDVEEYEGLYQVSNTGKVKSFHKNIILKPTKNSENGYLYVTLHKLGNKKRFYIHRLVAKAYLPHELVKNEVNHIDGCKENNESFNLEWCTRSENELHAYKTGLKKPYPRNGENNPNAKLTDKQKLEIKQLREKGLLLKEISKIYGIGLSQISRISHQNINI